MLLPAVNLGLGLSFGSGVAGGFFGPLILTGGIALSGLAGAAIGGLVAMAIKACCGTQKIPYYNTGALCLSLEQHDNWFGQKKDKPEKTQEGDKTAPKPMQESQGGAQAPGKPTEKDGYTSPKNWDGKKRRHPKNGNVGWPDIKGNIWVPTGVGPLAHGGPHWDVQYPDGKSYDNVYP